MEYKPLFMVNKGGDVWWLTEESNPKFYKNHRPATHLDITPYSMAEMMDQDAENANHHSFVGKHKQLASLLISEAGMDAATSIMRAIVGWGGLHAD